MERTYRIHEAPTGRPLSIPVHAPGSWNQSLTARGGGRHQIVIPTGGPFTPAQWQQSTLRWWHAIVEYWDGVPVYAGIIADKRWDFAAGVLHLTTVTVDALLEDRYPFGIGADPKLAVFDITGASYRSAIERAVQRGAGDTWWENQTWRIPLRFHALGETGSFSQSYPLKDWKTLAKIISGIRELEDGPDLAFVPFVDGDGWLWWDVLTGSPRLSGGPIIDLPVGLGRGTGVQRIEPRTPLTGVFALGEGLGDDRPVGQAGFLVGDPQMVRDTATDFPGKGRDLGSAARRTLADSRTDRQYEFDLFIGKRDDALTAADIRLGARFNLRWSADGYNDPGAQMQYMVAMAYDASTPHILKPEVQVG